ncbi:uncharacterized protein LOC113211176 [Frankliniella occidentalis]|uniref:Uncharacterized protein LOC113211176 n=1 Tax=Frankliniella occidentalis TaxID=133901 RepID=A0A6J1T3N8_FRAOC|nr:uncharacterized protein LOC113211176 [Frankliniella occidentalis]
MTAAGPLTVMPEKFFTYGEGKNYDCLPEKRKAVTETIRSNIAELYTGPQGSDMIVHEVPREDIVDENPEAPTVAATVADIGALQTVYDEIFPGASLHNYDYDHKHFEASTYQPKVENVEILINRNNVNIPSFDKMSPLLRTAVPKIRDKTRLELLYAVAHGNCSVAKLRALSDEGWVSGHMVDVFVDTYVAPEYSDMFAEFANEPIQIDEEAFNDWVKTKEDFKLGLMTDDAPFTYEEFKKYDLSIKTTCKPTLTQACITTYSAPQVIAAQNQRCNALFGPYVRKAMNRLMHVLDPTFSIYTDCSPEEYANILSQSFPPDLLDHSCKTELDISEYDKSQGLLAINIIVGIFRRLGVPENVCRGMYESHRNTVLVCREFGVKLFVDLQMKSGISWTLAGNTFVNMTAAACTFDLKKLPLYRQYRIQYNYLAHAGFVGDDSFILSPETFERSLAASYGSLFNLEVKVLTYETLSFCSKFVVRDGEKIAFVPDVVKVLSKLGRNDLTNPQHVEEYRISLADNLKCLSNARLIPEISRIVQERYGSGINTNTLCTELYNLSQDKESFQRLFEIPKEGRICYDPSLRKISIM